jgi:hypothetical protein
MSNIDAKIDRVLKLDQQATAGPWQSVRFGPSDYEIVPSPETGISIAECNKIKTSELIAEYRTICPDLARELRETRTRLAALESAASTSVWSGDTTIVLRELEVLSKWKEARGENR